MSRVSDEIRKIGKALAVKLGVGENEWCYGGSFSVKDNGVISLAKARKITGIAAAPRAVRVAAVDGRGGEWNNFMALTMAVSSGNIPSK